MWVRGDRLNDRQRRRALAVFVHRDLATNYTTDDEWLSRYCFRFDSRGVRLARFRCIAPINTNFNQFRI
jgi:hypothetical protein